VGNMTLREAVKRFDVSRPTLMKALQSGKVSAVKDEAGNWQIDPAELVRVYRPRGSREDKSLPPDSADLSTVDPRIATLERELEAEQIRRAAAETLAEERGRHLEDLRRLLPPPRPRWWWWRG
jgi:hypothetical protein